MTAMVYVALAIAVVALAVLAVAVWYGAELFMGDQVRCTACGHKVTPVDGHLPVHSIRPSRCRWLRIESACVASGREINPPWRGANE